MSAVKVHGYHGYSYGGCRCDVCRSAKAAYMREARARGREFAHASTRTAEGRRGNRYTAFGEGATRAVRVGIRHGRHGYEVRGCRCRECTTAHNAWRPS